MSVSGRGDLILVVENKSLLQYVNSIRSGVVGFNRMAEESKRCSCRFLAEISVNIITLCSFQCNATPFMSWRAKSIIVYFFAITKDFLRLGQSQSRNHSNVELNNNIQNLYRGWGTIVFFIFVFLFYFIL